MSKLIAIGVPCTILLVQYRMHPDISRCVSRLFYNGSLIDDPSVNKRNNSPPRNIRRYQLHEVHQKHRTKMQSMTTTIPIARWVWQPRLPTTPIIDQSHWMREMKFSWNCITDTPCQEWQIASFPTNAQDRSRYFRESVTSPTKSTCHLTGRFILSSRLLNLNLHPRDTTRTSAPLNQTTLHQ